MIVDLFLVYQFVKRLATPFEKWDAYELGIIDKEGNRLKKIKDFKTVKERQAFGRFDLLVLKLKKLLEKVPGGKSRIASYAAALYLIKEHNDPTSNAYSLNEEELQTKLDENMLVAESYHVNSAFLKMIEDAPTNNVGGGSIAGTGGAGGEPGLTPAQMKKYKDKNKMLKRFKDTVK